ncbi:MAG: hypothetical protein JNK03_04470 [Nitrospira sp.]|jgi:hypothetical protein|nr:hypothetical protein [Nitrospira sp.]
MVDVYAGVMFVNGGKGSPDMASVVCQGTLDANLAKGRKTGERRCTITDADGNRVFARYFCSGDILESYRGPCTILRGTGSVAGITGGGEMMVRVPARQFTASAGVENAHQQAIGVALWPAVQFQTAAVIDVTRKRLVVYQSPLGLTTLYWSASAGG